MPAEPMDEWEFNAHQTHLRDAKTRVERGDSVDPLVLIKVGERALQEIERLGSERDQTRQSFAREIFSEYERRYPEVCKELLGVEQKPPRRTFFHVIIEDLVSKSEERTN